MVETSYVLRSSFDRVSWSASFSSCSPECAAVALISASLILHLALAAAIGLSADECYGIGVAHDLKLSYFDYPPLNYWIAHVFMALLGDGRALRLPFVAMLAASSWTLYLLTRQLFRAAAGVWAVLALNLSGFFSLAGGWVLPDRPLMLCLLAAAYTVARALFPADQTRAPPSPWQTWIFAGIWIGLAGLSKYHSALFVVGLFVYLVGSPGAAPHSPSSGGMGWRVGCARHYGAGDRVERGESLGVIRVPSNPGARLRVGPQDRSVSRQSRPAGALPVAVDFRAAGVGCL